MPTRPRVLAAAMVLMTCGLAFGSPSDAEVRSRVDGFAAWAMTANPQTTSADEMDKKLNDLVNAFDIAELTPAQIGMLGQYLIADGSRLVEAYEAVNGKADAGGAEGATATVLAAWLWMYQQRTPPSAEELIEVLDHPALKEALAAGQASQVYEMASIFATNTPDAMVEPVMPRLVELAGTVSAAGGYESAINGAKLYNAISPEIEDKATRDALRDKTVAALDTAKKNLRPDEAYITEAIDNTRAHITFLGGPAPALTFAWTSDGFDATSLADLKGRVVVLDFWATWCRPCIAAFPKVRELVEHYKGSPVTVIGVTSAQGFHVSPEGERIDTKDAPEKEHGLMPGFMDAQDMTWAVAFTEQPVFNDQYFVQGIPHLAIIAPDGTVRHNGLNPHALSEEQEHAMIDALLDEFGLDKPEG